MRTTAFLWRYGFHIASPAQYNQRVLRTASYGLARFANRAICHNSLGDIVFVVDIDDAQKLLIVDLIAFVPATSFHGRRAPSLSRLVCPNTALVL